MISGGGSTVLILFHSVLYLPVFPPSPPPEHRPAMLPCHAPGALGSPDSFYTLRGARAGGCFEPKHTAVPHNSGGKGLPVAPPPPREVAPPVPAARAARTGGGPLALRSGGLTGRVVRCTA